MHTTVLIPYLPPRGDDPLAWVLDGYAGQELAPGHTLDVRVGVDGPGPLPSARPGMAVHAYPRTGAAGIRNLLVRETSGETDLLVFGNADARPDPDLVQRHADAMAGLPDGSLVLGSAPWDRDQVTALDVLADETPFFFSFCNLEPRRWYDFRVGYTINLSIRRRDFLASGGFHDELRPVYHEDLAFACRVLGPERRGVWYEPAARVLHRHPTTLEQYLDREELLGIMAPVLHRVCPAAAAVMLDGRDPGRLAEEFRARVADPGPLGLLYRRLREKLALSAASLGEGEARRRNVRALYQTLMPVKLLAFRLGFIRGMELVEDSCWLERRPNGLWSSALESENESYGLGGVAPTRFLMTNSTRRFLDHAASL